MPNTSSLLISQNEGLSEVSVSYTSQNGCETFTLISVRVNTDRKVCYNPVFSMFKKTVKIIVWLYLFGDDSTY